MSSAFQLLPSSSLIGTQLRGVPETQEDPFASSGGKGKRKSSATDSDQDDNSTGAPDSASVSQSVRSNASFAFEVVEQDSQSNTSTTLSNSFQSGTAFRTYNNLDDQSRRSIATPTSECRRLSQNFYNLTINKLKFDSLGLYGRQEEIQTLQTCFDDLLMKKKKQLVFVHGYSGVGKTSLASTLATKSTEAGGCFIQGKFEPSGFPYSGILTASQGMATQMEELKMRYLNMFLELKNKLLESLGNKAFRELLRVFPAIEEVLLENNDQDEITNQQNTEQNQNENKIGDIEHDENPDALLPQQPHQATQEAKVAFNNSCRIFMRVFCRFLGPVVLLLDDLQWADQASLELILAETGLLGDMKNQHLMIVGIYRSNEVSDDHLLSKLKADVLQATSSDDKDKPSPAQQLEVDVTDLPLGNLSIAAVQQVTRALMNMEDDEYDESTLPLAELCHRKTQGNAFYLTNLLSVLQERNFLRFNFGLMGWTWDIDEIDAATQASENVVDLLKSVLLKQKSNHIQELLTLAAFLGHSFDDTALLIVWQSFREKTDDQKTAPTNGDTKKEPTMEEELAEALAACETDGFVKKMGDSYNWVHDSIREAALSLTPLERQAELSKRIGSVLFDKLNESQLENLLFVVTNLLNTDSSKETASIADLKLAQLNLRAAGKASRCAGFDSAAKYIECGIRRLPPGCWTDHYDLALEMHSLGAEVADCVANEELMAACCTAVIEQAHRPIKDKLRVYHVLIKAKITANSHQEAFDLCLDILGKCGCRLPRRPLAKVVNVVKSLVKVKASAKYRTDQEIKELPLMTDEMRLEQMRLLDTLMTCAYYVGDLMLMVSVLKSMRWTLKYGICDYSPHAFSVTGSVLTEGSEDFQGGAIYARYAIKLLNRVPNRTYADARMRAPLSACLQRTTWTYNLLKPLVRGYEMGMQCGETQSALYNIYTYLVYACHTGKPLGSIERDCRVYSAQMRQLKRDDIYRQTSAFWQLVLNLIGKSENTVILTGEAMDELEFEETAATNKYYAGVLYGVRLLAHSYFGDYEYVAHLSLAAMANPKIKEVMIGHPLTLKEPFHRGLAFLEMAHRATDGGRKYQRLAKTESKTLSRWVEKGNPNAVNCNVILDAEWAALKGKGAVAKRLYEKAIMLCVRGGFLHEAGLASERYALFLSRGMNDADEAAFRTEEAINYYREWGAHRKAEVLEKEWLSQGILNQTPT